MGESSTPESTKSYLDVGIIAALTVAANHLLPTEYHSEATTIVPFLGGGIAWGIRWYRKRLAYKRLVELETRWLNELITQRNAGGLPKRKQEELDEAINEQRKALRELQIENIKIQ